ncbi:hypothetical protein BsWGS_26301 [Bradybaena similaris]
MARPGERMRLKDRIIDNISKTIKSIQELVFYQYKDPLLTGCDDSVVLYNGNRLCHKLCENLDHTLLHGLRNVMRGYWRVVKQLSPHAMVKEIDMLVNVTTDLGRGRAWLYASLNEGLLESYIRLLCDNDQLLKKYYAKEALVLDRDRMSVLLTLASGLDCVAFKLDYDLPYLDLNAYPPRSRSNSEQDGDVSSDSSDSYLGHPSHYRSISEIFSTSPFADSHQTNDSDSVSLASLDVCQMKASTISADSGFPTDAVSTNGAKQYNVSIETVINTAHQNGTSADSASLSSLSSSSGDPDRHQRLENVSSSFGRNDDSFLLEVIHMKGKKVQPGKSKRKKVERSSLCKSDTKAIQSDFHSQDRYIKSSKAILAVGKGSNETRLKLKNMAEGSVLDKSYVVKNVSCDCRQRETLSSNITSGLSRTVVKQEPGVTASSGHSSTTRNCCAEASGSICTLSLETQGCTSSGLERLANSLNTAEAQDDNLSNTAVAQDDNLSNTAVVQDDNLSQGCVCLSNSSDTAVLRNTSPCSELCGLNNSSVIYNSGTSSANSVDGLFSSDFRLVPGPCAGGDQSCKYASETQGTPTAAAMPQILSQPSCCVASLTTERVHVNLSPDVEHPSQPIVACAMSQVGEGCVVQGQHNVACAQSQQIGACDQDIPDVASFQSQPDVSYFQSQSDVSYFQSQHNGARVGSQPDVMSAQNEHDKACFQDKPNTTFFQSQHSEAFSQSQPCVNIQPTISDADSQLFVTEALRQTNSGCVEQVKMKCIVDENLKEDPEDDVDVYSSNKEDVSEESQSVPKSLEQPSEVSSLKSSTPLEDDIHEIAESSDYIDGARHDAGAEDVDLSLRLDTNTVLQLMLDVFCQEDEQFLKMFVTWENQAEGGTNVAYLLISSHCLYVLHHQRAVKIFLPRSCTALKDIIFISIGLNGQTLNIESRGKNKQKQKLWITPGNHRLSQAIVTCLADAVKTANEHLAGKSRFSVGTEVPLQKIALRKYISKELSIKPQDVALLDYSLVFWEDLSAASCSHSGVYKEGRLDLRTQDRLKGYTWKPVYVVLKNNILSVKNDKSDLRPHSFLRLGSDQCVGCRLTSHAGRDHCVELILAEGCSWLLSAASRAEISEWSHSLCLAVSQGTVESDISAACIPCCAVVANQHLFLCHEDLYSKFHRTLTRLSLGDVMMVALGGSDPTYCVIKCKTHEAGVSSRQWAFYFYSNEDLERHMLAIRTAWKNIHQTELPVIPIDDVAVDCSCDSRSNHLKRQLTLS